MKKFIYIFWIIFFIIIINAYSQNDVYQDVEDFMRNMSKVECPTINDLYKYYGLGAEEIEGNIADELCNCKVHEKEKKECKEKYWMLRDTKKKESPSLSLIWMKAKIPFTLKYKIKRIIPINKKDTSFKHELVEVDLSKGFHVTLFRTLDTKMVEEFGKLSVSQINGIKADQLIAKDMKDGKLKLLFDNYIKSKNGQSCRNDIESVIR